MSISHSLFKTVQMEKCVKLMESLHKISSLRWHALSQLRSREKPLLGTIVIKHQIASGSLFARVINA
jgi:hypothetical protein